MSRTIAAPLAALLILSSVTHIAAWGGDGHQTGALYCGCPAGTYYRDADGDGHGDRLQLSCGPATGYVSSADDCDDAAAAAWSAPGEARDLMFTNATTLVWSAPADLGGLASPVYDVVRASYLPSISTDFVCAATDLGSLTATDFAIRARRPFGAVSS